MKIVLRWQYDFEGNWHNVLLVAIVKKLEKMMGVHEDLGTKG